MGQAQAEIEIDRSPDDVWAVVSDFGGLAGWMPGIESCVLKGDDRVLSMMNMEITERLLAKDNAARSITYGIVDGPVPVEHHQATITVAGSGDSSHVTWAVDTDDAMTDMMLGMYQQSLGALKTHLEG